MKTVRYKRIAVKIGSNVLTTPHGELDIPRMASIVDQIAELHQSGVDIILISSGAVASGRSILKVQRKLNPVDQRQLYSAVGQAILINHYFELFKQKGLICGQVLTTKENFRSRRHYLNQKNCMQVMLENGVIPVVNENDAISVSELMFTDNDELSGLIASMMDVDALLLLSNIDGLYDGDPADPHSSVIRYIHPGEDLKHFIKPGKSTFGRGGMLTKSTIARKVAEEGITVYIANGKKESILLDLLDPEKEPVCTQFLPGEKSSSAIKKWIAHSEDFAQGAIHINEGCFHALTEKEASSILPIGITRIEGHFEKGDIIQIIDHTGRRIGVGLAQYGSSSAEELLGKKGEKPLVHYDYLYIDIPD